MLGSFLLWKYSRVVILSGQNGVTATLRTFLYGFLFSNAMFFLPFGWLFFDLLASGSVHFGYSSRNLKVSGQIHQKLTLEA